MIDISKRWDLFFSLERALYVGRQNVFRFCARYRVPKRQGSSLFWFESFTSGNATTLSSLTRSTHAPVFLATPSMFSNRSTIWGFVTNNAFSPSVQCTATENEARRLVLVIRSSFLLFYCMGHWCVPTWMMVHVTIWQNINYLGQLRKPVTRLGTGSYYLPYEKRQHWLYLHFLQRWRVWANLIMSSRKGLNNSRQRFSPGSRKPPFWMNTHPSQTFSYPFSFYLN